jgi:hypothetical protein
VGDFQGIWRNSEEADMLTDPYRLSKVLTVLFVQ